MIIVDAHCDTITRIMNEGKKLYQNDCHIDIKRLKEYGSYVQFFAAFIDTEYLPFGGLRRAVQIIDEFYNQIEKYNEDIMICCSYNDICSSMAKGKIAAVLSIEGGEALQGDLSAVRIFYRLGVRSICLTWNYRNEIADGIRDDISGGGLTSFGRNLVEEMNSLGMMIDLSHISEKGFWDVIELSSAPIIVSHSNSRSLCDNKRNLTDSQIKAVANNGGVIGVNFYPIFLNGTKDASIIDIINHIDHIAGLVGTDNIGIGSDFDGIDCTPNGLAGVEGMQNLINELLKLNYSEVEVEKIAGQNFLRVLKRIEELKND
jgi:membrane dipeptidase